MMSAFDTRNGSRKARGGIALVTCLAAAAALAGGGGGESGRYGRVVVELESPSLVSAARAGEATIERLPGGRLDLDGAEARRALDGIDREHDEFRAALEAAAPSARVDREWRILYNGLAVTGADRGLLESLPRVKRVHPTDTVVYRPFLDASIPMIGAPAAWEAVGGQEAAGEGIKIAVIDSGIDVDNPFFDPVGYDMLSGYPLGEIEHTTAKIIAARAYFRPNDPVDPEKDEETPTDHDGHGSHCAGIAAGNADTVFELSDGTPMRVSGVAPRARLMAYKVFYEAQSGLDGALDPELMSAFEDAVADGADVISCSWGGPDSLVSDTPSSEVYLAALEAGVAVVFAAGNEGPGPGTIAYPGSLPEVVTAGSVRSGRAFAGTLDVTAPEPVPPGLVGIAAIEGAISPGFDSPLGPLPVRSAVVTGEGLSDDGCAPFPWGAFDGAAALIERGTCLFSEKVDNAYLAGAEAVVVFNDEEGASAVVMGGDGVDIPAVQIGNEEGLLLEKWVIDHPDSEISISDGMIAYVRPDEASRVSDFSSRGPTDAPWLKPDLAAPGSLVLSAAAHSLGQEGEDWALKSGTSMAAPHVSGAAALVRQIHPDLDPAGVKAVLLGSAAPFDDPSGEATPLDTGAGRLDLEVAVLNRAAASPPALSLGEGLPGQSFSAVVSIEDLGGAGELTTSWAHVLGPCETTPQPPDGTVVQAGQSVTVEFDCPVTAEPGEHAGYLLLEGEGTEISVPYHFRLRPVQNREALLLDMSFLQAEQTVLVDTYRALADGAGLDYEVWRVDEETGAPPLSELLRYRLVVVFTGNDQVKHEDDLGLEVLDVLSTYAHAGGSVIAAGQGPWRDSEHPRIAGLMGAAVDPGFPLFDKYTLELVEMESFLVYPIGSVPLLDDPLDVGPETDGQGDLTLLGETLVALGPGLPEVWTEPFLQMVGDQFVAGGYLGMLFDPYRGWGAHEEAEELTHRAALLGFGFERAASGTAFLSGREDLFEALAQWALERISVDAEVETSGPWAVIRAETSGAEAVQYEFDHGDGSPIATGPYHVDYYEYPELGTYTVTVLARAPLGAVGIDRVEVTLTEEPDAAPPDPVPDAGEPLRFPRAVEARTRDCDCAAAGSRSGLGIFGLMSALGR